ncbi:GNAT family N-acetyltransferase [Ensifer adhaerens]|uniref:GNAT family N-acetyltransferase n=1 Tax=Ensifer adhaerens TaxID=106592 RepID=UPI000FD71512|nr:GNAT family N-acetyltransferase [Ensifer adhaerens]MDF8357599.1 GNAT family N-acetyltransferase [Ensifer adhaerens]THA57087.1 N-acetyltransferase [Ensifer adhaerens]
MSVARWLEIDRQTSFHLNGSGRIERENDPDHSAGPRFWFAGCEDGNVFAVGSHVPDDLASRLHDLAVTEPPFLYPGIPRHLIGYLAVFANEPPVRHSQEVIYELPHSLAIGDGALLIGSDSEEGRELMQSWTRDGPPQGLVELGFREEADFWAPWCVANVDGEIASIAFAARLTESGAELGLVTARSFRGRGLAAAATAGWSRLPSLSSRTLFYSTSRENLSSQRVAARLGLRLRGVSFRIE